MPYRPAKNSLYLLNNSYRLSFDQRITKKGVSARTKGTSGKKYISRTLKFSETKGRGV